MTPLEIYERMLTRYGLLVTTEENELRFKYEGAKYTLLTYADDPQYVGVRTTYAIPTGVRRGVALDEANSATRKSKVAKTYLVDNRGISIAAELFVADPEIIEEVLFRLINIVQIGANDIFARFAERTPKTLEL